MSERLDILNMLSCKYMKYTFPFSKVIAKQKWGMFHQVIEKEYFTYFKNQVEYAHNNYECDVLEITQKLQFTHRGDQSYTEYSMKSYNCELSSLHFKLLTNK